VNLLDVAFARHFTEQSSAAVVTNQVGRSLAKLLEPRPHRFLAIVVPLLQPRAAHIASAGHLGRLADRVIQRLAPRTPPAPAQAATHFFLIHKQRYHRREIQRMLPKYLVEEDRLLNGSRVTVHDESLRPVAPAKAIGNQLVDNRVRDKATT